MGTDYWKLGIIGWPLGYSLSPAMHRAALEASGLRGEYQEYPVRPEELEKWLESAIKLGLNGFNVTMPHKEAVFQWLTSWGKIEREMDQITGAINTVKVSGRRLIGYNTDGDGFLRALTDPPRSIDLKGKKVLLLGAGGAAQAVAVQLAYQGKVGQITIWNRHPERAVRLAEKVNRLRSSHTRCQAVGVEELDKGLLETVDLLVNATPVGMEGKKDETLLPVEVKQLRKDAVVYDLVYAPPKTALIRSAQRRGNPAITGLEMLANQAAVAFHLWTENHGKPVISVMRQVLSEHLSARA